VKLFWSLLGYLRPYWVSSLLAPLLMALEVAMDLAQPRLLQTIIDQAIAQHDTPMVFRIGGLMLAAGVVGLIGGAGCTVFTAIAAYGFGTDVRGAVFRRIHELSFANLDRLETGRLITRLTSDVDQVQEAVAMLLRIMVRAPLLVVGSLIMAVLTNPQLSLLLAVIGPLVLLALVLISRKGQALFFAVQERLDRLNVTLQESLAGVRVVKAFVRGEHECQRFERANVDLMEWGVRAACLMAVAMPIMMMLVSSGVVGVIWFGGWQVQEGTTKVGQLLAFVSYLLQMLSSLMMVGMLVIRLAQAEASAQRIREVLDAEPEVHDAAVVSERPERRGRLEFDQVEFGYDGQEAEPVLRDISFVAEPGQRVAIMGATGSGKSSLTHLVPRFYDVTGGRVLVDGVDVRDLRQEDLREGIGVVLQDTILFSGTIRDNIRYGKPDATDDEVEEAARQAQAHDFIAALPEGYETVLGQRGVNLSGGQKQRLAIARALLCRPSILVLDDCTSSVDAATEAHLMRALGDAASPCTRLIVAQRIGSVVDSDQILVLEDGVIAAAGTHRELLERSPVYQDIVRSQLGDGEVPRG